MPLLLLPLLLLREGTLAGGRRPSTASLPARTAANGRPSSLSAAANDDDDGRPSSFLTVSNSATPLAAGAALMAAAAAGLSDTAFTGSPLLGGTGPVGSAMLGGTGPGASASLGGTGQVGSAMLGSAEESAAAWAAAPTGREPGASGCGLPGWPG